MKRVIFLTAACFIIILGCKKTFEQNNGKEANSLLADYSATYKLSDTASTELINPNLLNFTLAKAISVNGLGAGYLIPLAKQRLPDVSTAGHLSFFAFYSSSNQAIYQVFAQANIGSVTVEQLAKNMIEPKDTNIAYCVIKSDGLPAKLYAPAGGISVLQKATVVKKLAISKQPGNKAINTVSNCSEENTYTIVRYYYNTQTGAIISAQVIGEICLDTDPFDPTSGTGNDNQLPLHRLLLKPTSCLDSAQDRKFGQTVSTWYSYHCMNRTIYNYLGQNHIQVTVCTDSTGNGWNSSVNAAYNPATNTMNIRNSNLGYEPAFREEIFHAAQNSVYSGGTAQYASTANGNIEFEYRFVYFAINYDANPFGYDPDLRDQFEAYVNAVTNNKTTLPNDPLQLDIPGYFSYAYFAEKFTQHLNSSLNTNSYHFSNGVQPEMIPFLGNKYVYGCN